MGQGGISTGKPIEKSIKAYTTSGNRGKSITGKTFAVRISPMVFQWAHRPGAPRPGRVVGLLAGRGDRRPLAPLVIGAPLILRGRLQIIFYLINILEYSVYYI